MSTLADLKRKVLRHLQLPTNTGVVDALTVREVVNTARRDVMRECGGMPPEPLTIDLTAGVSEYAIDRIAPIGRVTGLSVKSTATAYPNLLSFIPASQAPYALASGCPRVWTLKIVSERPGGFAVDEFAAVSAVGGPVIRLFPTPDTSVAGGLVIHCATGAGDLVNDTDTSALPVEVDDAACWLAASELAIDLSDDPSIAARADVLAGRAAKASRDARKALRQFFGGRTRMVPSVGFGDESGYEPTDYDWMEYGAPQEATVLPNRRRKIFNPAVGAIFGTVDLSDHPADMTRTDTAMAICSTIGFIAGLTFSGDGRSATVVLEGGVTFSAGDAVYLWYDAVA